ncbi:NAD-dependent epimerase/dehydratase family protein [Paenibacillus arenilitoris]|uniref:NAD-dependent epimerase/dehydratase family protein n=1 Tax=Paenibacillus arenilitoris TaxID=2772299 RepID=A0A927HA96_9BACL|nr:NAD-dependent epimerase/dehydratase family protein [Paenibacillus arenilitoris]MBD2872404.1 NAD-dependent epimerase/dehydratase family protein [Paenibacillus arenilitoris]
MRILITGGAGFIASHIAERFVRAGHEVTVLDNLSHGDARRIPPQARLLQADLLSPQVGDLFKAWKPEVVCHHAAQIDVSTSLKQPLTDAATNILGTLALLLHCRNHGTRKIIYASSAAVYGTPLYLPVDENHPVKPLSFYGISKHSPEHYIEAYSSLYGLDYTILRYANVYGPRQDPTGEGGVISIFLNKLARGETPVIYGSGNQTRDFIYVQDIVSANAAALTAGSRQTLNVSCNRSTSVNELLHMLCRLSGRTVTPEYKPAQPGDIVHSVLSNRAAAASLNWTPRYSVLEGLKDTLASIGD